MLHTLRIVLRHLGRQKVNSALHIIGLTLGMSVCLLIGLFLNYELSFDTYHDNADRTYRINSGLTDREGTHYNYRTPIALADTLRSVSAAEHVVMIHATSDNIIEINPQKRFNLEYVLVADAEFPHVFNLEAVEGNVFETLRSPYQAILTESTAKKLFGKEEALGKTFIYKTKFPITVGALIRDLPPTTHLHASMILSFVAEPAYLGAEPNFNNSAGTSTYVVLPESFDPNILEAQLRSIADSKINAFIPKDLHASFQLQPLADLHFDTVYGGGGEWTDAIDTSWLWFFALIGLVVLALAVINFINLSTAQALTRAKEIGVRKCSGAGRINLIGQFLIEAWVLALISGVLALIITQMSLPFMNVLLEKSITLNFSPALLISVTLGALLTGLLAGLYPAFVIARFNPAVTLKAGGTMAGNHDSAWLRKVLIVSQFAIAAGLMITVALMALQLNFLRTKSLGFDKDNIVLLGTPDPHKAPAFANEVRKISSVKDISFSSTTPGSKHPRHTLMSRTDFQDPDRFEVTWILGDEHFCPMYGLRLLSGRFPVAADTNWISRTLPEEKRILKVVVNEMLVETLGFLSNEKALGKRFWISMGSGHAEIIGVVANFNSSSLHRGMVPVVIGPDENYPMAGIKLEAKSNVPQALATIEAIWKKTFTDGVFDFALLDKKNDSLYRSEASLYTLFKIFAGLALLISCLGLWGLSTFTAQQRTKEIGIRKVLGASVRNLVTLLSKDFLVMVGLAMAISFPVAYFAMEDWLETFAYHIDVSWQVFAVTGLAAIIITLFTVSFQAIKTALTNPVESLRNE